MKINRKIEKPKPPDLDLDLEITFKKWLPFVQFCEFFSRSRSGSGDLFLFNKHAPAYFFSLNLYQKKSISKKNKK